MTQWRRCALLVALCSVFCTVHAQQAQLVSALINSCETNEGAGEWVMVYSGGTDFNASTSTIDIRYGSVSPASTTITDQFDPNGDATFVNDLNNLLTGGCDFSFINVTDVSNNIPAGSHILIFNDDVLTSGSAINYSGWCGQGLGNIYVLFSTDTSWPSSGFLDDSPTGTRYFRSTINSNIVDFNYTDNWATDTGGDYVTWIDGGGAGSIYSNYGSCVPNNADALPVTLINFSAQPMSDHIAINWSTADESGNSHFTLFRSKDGTNWVGIAVIPGQGTTEKVQHYQYRDFGPEAGRSYYRLMQTDFNGDFEVFELISVYYDPEQVKLRLFPNPSSDYIKITSSEKVGYISLVNSQGRVFRLNSMATNSVQAEFDIRHIPNGLYQVLIHGTDTTFKEKLIKVK